MSLLKNALYGLVSGFAEFLPVSSLGHQVLLMRLLGWDSRDPIRDLLVHIAIMLALLTACRSAFSRLGRERRLAARGNRSRSNIARGAYDLRLIRTATIPMVLCLLLYLSARRLEESLVWIALFFAVNGVILVIPEYMRGANKDSRAMSGLDGILLGVSGAICVLPGVSRVGAMCAYASVRGAGRQHSLNWALLLSLPALLIFCGFDILSAVTFGRTVITFSALIGYVFSALAAYCGSYLSIVLIRFLTVRTSLAGFAFYSWGAALFSMIIYLIT